MICKPQFELRFVVLLNWETHIFCKKGLKKSGITLNYNFNINH